MNKKLLSIACMALTLCMFSTPFAADAIEILGVSGRSLMGLESVSMDLGPSPEAITMLNISKTGVAGKNGRFSTASDTITLVKNIFKENPPCIVANSFTTETTSAGLGRSIVGRNQLTISAENFVFQLLTVFGTNGQLTLNFKHPQSLIKSITLAPSDIKTSLNDQELHIGSIWGLYGEILRVCPHRIFKPYILLDILQSR